MTKNRFPNAVYNTPLGSFALTQAILNNKLNDEQGIKQFRTLFWRASKKKWNMADPNLLESVAKFFKCNLILDNVAVVVSQYNILFTFFVIDEEGDTVVLPLQEDGFMPITLREGKIYPLVGGKHEFHFEQ